MVAEEKRNLHYLVIIKNYFRDRVDLSVTTQSFIIRRINNCSKYSYTKYKMNTDNDINLYLFTVFIKIRILIL